MKESDPQKPIPARPPERRGKPTPVRELNGEAAPPPVEADVAEVELDVEGARWTVRVLGRSGGASGASPPLLLLGFWAEGRDEEPSREALVVARSLADMSEEGLRQALSEASEPRDPDREVPFFDGAVQKRRR